MADWTASQRPMTLDEAWAHYRRNHPERGTQTWRERNSQFPDCGCEKCHPHIGRPKESPAA